MFTNGAVLSYEPASVAGLYDSVLQHDFELLRRAGLRNAVAFGDALMNADNGAPQKTFSYFAQMPKADSTLSALSRATQGLMRELKGRNTLLELKGSQGDHAVRFAFNLDGRRVDVTLVNAGVPGAECAARAAPIGLNGIAVNERGFGFASEAYLRDQSLKCLTINDDLSAADRYVARRKARQLVQQPAYKDFKIVG